MEGKMQAEKKSNFSKKHPKEAIPDATIRAEIEKRLKGKDKLPCAVAFAIAKDIRRLPKEVGNTADLLGIHLSKCQLGLFGYLPEKKIVAPAEHVDGTLRKAISGALKDGKLHCEAAWNIAETLGVSRMTVSAACEAMKIKITACQLGAF
jgi:hypothetical protein